MLFRAGIVFNVDFVKKLRARMGTKAKSVIVRRLAAFSSAHLVTVIAFMTNAEAEHSGFGCLGFLVHLEISINRLND